MKSVEHPELEFRPPRSYDMGRPVPITVITIHTTEGHEDKAAAENGAAYDGRRTDGTSCHYFVDPDSAVQCVLTKDRAHAARYHGNRIGIHYELCGKAGQSVADWHDAESLAILDRAARLAAADAKRYSIPVLKLSAADVRNGKKGFCGHADITFAFPEDKGTHTDPGKSFPWPEFLGLVRKYTTPKPAVPRRPVVRPYPGHPIRRGDKSGTVSQVQAQLVKRGIRLTSDGDFGPATERAVLAFQKAKGLATDGVVGPKTWKALFA